MVTNSRFEQVCDGTLMSANQSSLRRQMCDVAHLNATAHRWVYQPDMMLPATDPGFRQMGSSI